MRNYEPLMNKIDNLNLILAAIVNKTPSLSNKIQELHNSIDVFFDKQDISESIPELSEKVNNIFESLNLTEISLNSEKKDILKYLFEELDEWEIVHREIISDNFHNITQVTEEDLTKFQKNETIPPKIKEILWEDSKDINRKLIEKKSQAEIYWDDFRDDLQEKYPEVEVAALKDMIIESFVWQYAEAEILAAYVEKNPSLLKNNTEISIFGDIEGLHGILDLKSKTKKWWMEEWFKMVAIEIAAIAAGALTGWIWAIGIKAWVAATRSIKYLNSMNKIWNIANKWFKWTSLSNKAAVGSARMARFGGMSLGEGVTFHGGYVLARNMMEEQNISYEDGLSQSVFMVGAFKWVHGIWSKLGKNLSQPVNMAWEIATGWITLSALGFHNDGVLFSPGEWSAETVMQAFAMYAGLKAAGTIIWRIKFDKVDGKVVVRRELPRNAKLEVQSITNGEKYLLTTDKNGSIVKVFNLTKGKPLPKGAESAFIKKQIHNIREVHGTRNIFKMKEAQAETKLNLLNTHKKGISQLKNKDVYTAGNYSVTKTSGPRSGRKSRFEVNGPEWTRSFNSPKDAAAYINEKVPHSALLEQALAKPNAKTEKIASQNKDIRIGDEVFRVAKSGGKIKIEQKLADKGGYVEISLNKLTEKQIDTILEKVAGRGSVWYIEKILVAWQEKTYGNILGKEYFANLHQHLLGKQIPENLAAKIVQHLYKYSLGNTYKNLSNGLWNDGWRKVFVLRTLLTGKNSDKVLGGITKEGWKTANAWMPSWRNLWLAWTLAWTKIWVDYLNGIDPLSSGWNQDYDKDYLKAAILGPYALIWMELELWEQLVKHGIIEAWEALK